MKQRIDGIKFEEIRSRAKDLQNSYAERDELFKTYEDMYLMKWENKGRGSGRNSDTTRLTVSPTARNKVLGACRLLYSQDPNFKVSSGTLDDEAAEALENQIRRWWAQAGRVNRKPVHFDMILSSCLYGEMHTAITPVKDYISANQDDPRSKRIQEITPILFHSWNPRNGYPEFDELGLCAYYRTVETDWSIVAQKYKAYLPGAGFEDAYGSRSRKVQLNLFWDLTHAAVWIDNRALYCGEHGLGQIPVDVTRSSGSGLFNDNEDKVQPMLYTIAKSDLWNHESLFLTVMYSQLFSIGISPMYAFKSLEGRGSPGVSIDNGITFYVLGKDDSLDVMNNKGIMPAEVKALSDMTTNLIESSTIYAQAFGERGGGSATFSETSLLSQSARLPLVEAQRLGGHGIGSAIELALATIRDKRIHFRQNGYELKGGEIPTDVEVQTTLSVNLPQERLQQANLGIMLKNSNLVSDEYIQENILGISNTNEMQRQIIENQAGAGLTQYVIAQEMEKLQQQASSATPFGQGLSQSHMDRDAASADLRSGRHSDAVQSEGTASSQALTAGQASQRMMNELRAGATPGLAGLDAQAFNPTGGVGVPPEMGGMVPGAGLAGRPDIGGIAQ